MPDFTSGPPTASEVEMILLSRQAAQNSERFERHPRRNMRRQREPLRWSDVFGAISLVAFLCVVIVGFIFLIAYSI